MGKWVTTPRGFTSFLSDRIGYKSGLALNNSQMAELLDRKDPLYGLIKEPTDELVRIYADHIEDTFQMILYRLGTIDSSFVGHAPTLLGLKYQNDASLHKLFQAVLKLFGEHQMMPSGQVIAFADDQFDEEKFLYTVKVKLGAEAFPIANTLLKMTKESIEASPWDWLNARVFEWDSPLDLKELFDSENLSPQYGSFIDQRFINYLERNPNDLSNMNWRKFEGLTAEYFERQGYRVELGPGRNDEGIDIRIWAPGSDIRSVPATLVQCKRVGSKIDKVLVKSLYADILEEKANGGIIVTTSEFAPGTRKTCKARNYPVREANRDKVIEWIKDLRNSGTGVFMGR